MYDGRRVLLVFFWVILKTINSLLSFQFPLNIPVESLTPLTSSRYIRTDRPL